MSDKKCCPPWLCWCCCICIIILVIVIVKIIIVPCECECLNCSAVCGNGICESENMTNCPEDCNASVECRDENSYCTPEDIPCCEGLVEVPMAFLENGSCIAASCGQICRPCGDGICQENENECSCPSDCGEPY
jgi:hypothetical protein